jgi:hypothetical protein
MSRKILGFPKLNHNPPTVKYYTIHLYLLFLFSKRQKIHRHWTPLLASWYSKLSSAGVRRRQELLSHTIFPTSNSRTSYTFSRTGRDGRWTGVSVRFGGWTGIPPWRGDGLPVFKSYHPLQHPVWRSRCPLIQSLAGSSACNSPLHRLRSRIGVLRERR